MGLFKETVIPKGNKGDFREEATGIAKGRGIREVDSTGEVGSAKDRDPIGGQHLG